MEKPVNSSDPRVKRTRKLLLDAFYELTAEKEMRDITVQDVTERATVNRATFYAHFRDKDALMDAALRGLVNKALTAGLPPESPVTKANLRLLFRLMCDFMNKTARRCPKSLGEHSLLMNSAVQAELALFVREWMTHATPIEHRKQGHLETVASLVSWSIYGATVEWMRQPGAISQETLATEMVDLLTGGICKGIIGETEG
jgi:AcrR family transcriptional regulator